MVALCPCVLWWSQGRLAARVAVAVCCRAATAWWRWKRTCHRCVAGCTVVVVAGVVNVIMSLAGGHSHHCDCRHCRPQQGGGGDHR